jgi:hypothetical protein
MRQFICMDACIFITVDQSGYHNTSHQVQHITLPSRFQTYTRHSRTTPNRPSNPTTPIPVQQLTFPKTSGVQPILRNEQGIIAELHARTDLPSLLPTHFNDFLMSSSLCASDPEALGSLAASKRKPHFYVLHPPPPRPQRLLRHPSSFSPNITQPPPLFFHKPPKITTKPTPFPFESAKQHPRPLTPHLPNPTLHLVHLSK